MKDKKDLKKKIAATATVASLSSSVLLGAAFQNPDDMFKDIKNKDAAKNTVYIQQNDDDEELDTERQSVVNKAIRNTVYKIPAFIRVIFCVPMWAIGSLLLGLFTVIFKGVLTPIGDAIIHLIISTLIMLLVIVICVKILFPDFDLKKILNKRTILIVLIGNIIMFILDLVMPKIWDKYTFYRNISKFVIGMIVVTIVMIPFVKLFRKKNKEPEIIIPKI